MSIEAPPTINASIFNSAYFSSSNETTLTRSTADARYLQLTGGTETGPVVFNSTISTPVFKTASYSSTTGVALGAENILNGTANSATTSVGTYIKTCGWDSPASVHTISRQLLTYNASSDNYMGKLIVFASNKATSTQRTGMLELIIHKTNGNASVSITTSHTMVNSNLKSTASPYGLAASASGANIVITALDSAGAAANDVMISWIFFGAV